MTDAPNASAMTPPNDNTPNFFHSNGSCTVQPALTHVIGYFYKYRRDGSGCVFFSHNDDVIFL